MTDEQIIRDAATRYAMQMYEQGAANVTGNNQDEDLIRLAEKIAAFITAGTVPSGS